MAKIYDFNLYKSITDFIKSLHDDKFARNMEQPIVSKVSGQRRMLVKSKGWLPLHQITWGDEVKVRGGIWVPAEEIDELQKKE